MVSQEAQAFSRRGASKLQEFPKEFTRRMKRLSALFLTLALGTALSAQAQAPAAAPAGPSKIAVIAFQAAVSQTNEFQRNFADLQKKYDPKRQQIQALSTEVENLEKQLQAQGDKLSDAERASKAKTLEDKQKQAKRDLEDAQNDFQQEIQQLFGGVASKVGEVLVTYAQQQGFTLVVDGSENQQQSPLVLYASPSTDITRAVIDAYNVKSGVPAPPAAPTPQGKPGQ
jgi:outer membrane protein